MDVEKVRAATPVIADPADPGSFAAAAGQGIGGSLPFGGMSANGPGLVKNAITNRQLAANAAMGAASGVGAKSAETLAGHKAQFLVECSRRRVCRRRKRLHAERFAAHRQSRCKPTFKRLKTLALIRLRLV